MIGSPPGPTHPHSVPCTCLTSLLSVCHIDTVCTRENMVWSLETMYHRDTVCSTEILSVWVVLNGDYNHWHLVLCQFVYCTIKALVQFVSFIYVNIWHYLCQCRATLMMERGTIFSVTPGGHNAYTVKISKNNNLQAQNVLCFHTFWACRLAIFFIYWKTE